MVRPKQLAGAAGSSQQPQLTVVQAAPSGPPSVNAGQPRESAL